jgi:hypothetical protein
VEIKEIKIQGMIEKEWAGLCLAERLMKGTLNRVEKNGKITYLLTWKGEKNKTKTVYVKKNQIPEVRKMLKNYKKAKKTIEKVVTLTALLFKRS